jgi:hypothetical protein
MAVLSRSSNFPWCRPAVRSYETHQVTLAAGVIAGARIDLAGRIGRLVLASLMPPRRLRTSPRVVKRAISKYNARGKIDRSTYQATIDIVIHTADLTADDEP